MEIGEHFPGFEAGVVSVAPGALNVSRYEAVDWRKVPVYIGFYACGAKEGLSLPMPICYVQTGKTCVCSRVNFFSIAKPGNCPRQCFRNGDTLTVDHVDEDFGRGRGSRLAAVAAGVGDVRLRHHDPGHDLAVAVRGQRSGRPVRLRRDVLEHLERKMRGAHFPNSVGRRKNAVAGRLKGRFYCDNELLKRI